MNNENTNKSADRPVTIIAAVCRDGAIGRDGDLVCRLRPDMRHFRETTTGHTVVMGRKTWESLRGPLPNRHNIVVTRQKDYTAPGATVCHSLDEALAHCDLRDEGTIFVIGGQQLYTQAIDLAQKMILTCIDIEAPDADTYFPDIDYTRWHSEHDEARWLTDPDTNIRYRFICLNRK